MRERVLWEGSQNGGHLEDFDVREIRRVLLGVLGVVLCLVVWMGLFVYSQIAGDQSFRVQEEMCEVALHCQCTSEGILPLEKATFAASSALVTVVKGRLISRISSLRGTVDFSSGNSFSPSSEYVPVTLY
jgi:hypothetical protein